MSKEERVRDFERRINRVKLLAPKKLSKEDQASQEDQPTTSVAAATLPTKHYRDTTPERWPEYKHADKQPRLPEPTMPPHGMGFQSYEHTYTWQGYPGYKRSWQYYQAYQCGSWVWVPNTSPVPVAVVAGDEENKSSADGDNSDTETKCQQDRIEVKRARNKRKKDKKEWRAKEKNGKTRAECRSERFASATK